MKKDGDDDKVENGLATVPHDLSTVAHCLHLGAGLGRDHTFWLSRKSGVPSGNLEVRAAVLIFFPVIALAVTPRSEIILADSYSQAQSQP